MHAPAFFAAVADGKVIATTASATRKYRFAVVYGRTVAYWSSDWAGAQRQVETFSPRSGVDGKRIEVGIVDVVQTLVRLDVGDAWPLKQEAAHV
jgi:hypothetical protein